MSTENAFENATFDVAGQSITPEQAIKLFEKGANINISDRRTKLPAPESAEIPAHIHDPLGVHTQNKLPPSIPDCIPGPFTGEEYNRIVNDTYNKIRILSETKSREYSGDEDRLANFRRNGADIGIPMETVWRVYAGKHWDAISQFVKDLNTGKHRTLSEPMEGRVDDLIVYLLLFKCMLVERHANV